MTDFISRVSLDYNCALERIGELGSCFEKTAELIPAEHEPETLVTRFTFCVIKLKAASREECGKAITQAWNRFAPGTSNRIRVLTVPFSDDEQGRLIREIFGAYYGTDDYLKLVAELYDAFPLLKENGSLGALMMQNYLFAIDAGNGFTTLLSSLGDFLRKMGLYGEKTAEKTQYAEFRMSNRTGSGAISADEMIEKFCGDYLDDCNIVGIDVSWYLDGEKYDELRRFLQRLYRFQNKVAFMFRVPFLEKKAFDRVAALFDDVSLLRVVQIPPLHESVLAERMWDKLRSLGVTPDKSVLDVFFAKVNKEKNDGRFYGFKTAEKIADEMILKKASHDAAALARGEDVNKKRITGDDLPGDFAGLRQQKSGYDELAGMIGMQEIAARVREIVSQVKVSMKNETLDRPCIHMRFLGHPGTGKTTVARIIGQIFREEGILRKGAFLEYSARSLCAEYVGQTAVRTASICRDAYGSVLFIDEAYALYENDYSYNDYGKEALTTLISEMENHRDDMLVIMAGYTDDMETLMRGNAGLRSRMPYVIRFPNYSKEQLFEIFMLMVKKHFSYSEQLAETAHTFFSDLSDEYVASKEFANARFVRNLYERTWSKAALRAALAGSDVFELTREDFLAASAEEEFSEKLVKTKAKIGF
ncbi:MAG: AAA family ATPase [Clostridia bacterium]|nr:AAA family ATPase [Clostridia bacterium]